MLNQCLNPECGAPLHYLRSGRVLRTIHHANADRPGTVEHFWLCGDCVTSHGLGFLQELILATAATPLASLTRATPALSTDEPVHLSRRSIPSEAAYLSSVHL